MSNSIIKIEPRRCLIFGFGGVAKAAVPLILKNLPIESFTLIDRRRIFDTELSIFGNLKVSRLEKEFEYGKLQSEVSKIIYDNDIVLDFFGCSESLDIIKACNEKKGIVYLNASLEEYEDHPYKDQYSLYQAMYDYRDKYKPTFTGCIDSGANPGMITHFCILGIRNMAKGAIERKVPDADKIKELLDKDDLPGLVEQMKIDTIHISEIEDIEPNDPKKFEGKVTNSWCPISFHEEWNLPSEVSKGTHDKESLTREGYIEIEGSIPLSVITPYPIYLKTASPFNIFTGKCVRHPETLEISKIFSNSTHVPTVAFVYHPSRLPRQDMEKEGWEKLPKVVIDETTGGPLKGKETMGATLISSRKDIPSRWYGSIVTCEESRDVGCISNPTTLQVAAGVVSHLVMGVRNPNMGLCMPHDFDSDKIMEIAKPYLGTIYDCDLKFEISSKWDELIGKREDMDYDLVKK